MTANITSVASVLGALMVSGGIAMAADLPARAAPLEPAPIFSTVSGYVDVGVGIGWAHNSYSNVSDYGLGSIFTNSGGGRDSTWSIAGAGRANVWLSPSFSMQADVWGSSDSAKIKNCTGCGSANDTSFNIGTHLSYRDPNAFLVGIYGALGSLNGGNGVSASTNHGTIGLEGQVYFGATTLYAQAGYASTISAADSASANAWNARGVIRHYFNPNLRISGELGYAHLSFDSYNNNNNNNSGSANARQVNWGVGVENKFGTSPFSAFLKYEGTDTQFKSSSVQCCVYTVSSNDKTTAHAIKAGFRIYFNEGTLLANDRNGTTLDIRDPISSIGRGFGVNTSSNNNNQLN
ncbi:MAG: hypothetical protein JWM36_1138 [Hyphomicrobiales bacterium]|nr:hypothetical protein [Hyphomicrobiales bacterium]